MTVEQLLQRHQSAQPTDTGDPEAVDDQGTYGVVRAARERAIMVELRKRDGTVVAVPYALVEQVRYSPDTGITIHACGREFRIAGRHLNPAGPSSPKLGLFNGLCRHRVAWIAEAAHGVPSVADVQTASVDTIQW
jgi:hypothetical protein